MPCATERLKLPGSEVLVALVVYPAAAAHQRRTIRANPAGDGGRGGCQSVGNVGPVGERERGAVTVSGAGLTVSV